MAIKFAFKKYSPVERVSIVPLVFFRIVFGFCMLASTLRFLLLGWVEEQYIKPIVHFSYFGFEWLLYPPDWGVYALFLLLFLSCVGITLGLFYRLSAALFFLSFTYIELLDKTYYLNHYYFVSLVGLLLNFVPAHRFFSLDTSLKIVSPCSFVPRWTIDILKFQLALVYFYAGLAKINDEWLLNAMPLKLWLPANNDLPLLGYFFNFEWCAYAFSWAGMLFDTFIPFLFLHKSLRYYCYPIIIFFHGITGWMFPIGMFPLIMTACVPIFFSDKFHQAFILFISKLLRVSKPDFEVNDVFYSPKNYFLKVFLCLYIVFQLVFPWRYLLYPGNLFWTEEGYRFSWRVMLIEKAGTATFFVKDSATGREGMVDNREFLNSHQEKQMAMQPDMILQYAHFLAKYYENIGLKHPEVRAEVYVTLNGRKSQLLIDPNQNLAAEKEGFSAKKWIKPLDE